MKWGVPRFFNPPAVGNWEPQKSCWKLIHEHLGWQVQTKHQETQPLTHGPQCLLTLLWKLGHLFFPFSESKSERKLAEVQKCANIKHINGSWTRAVSSSTALSHKPPSQVSIFSDLHRAINSTVQTCLVCLQSQEQPWNFNSAQILTETSQNKQPREQKMSAHMYISHAS